MVAVGRQPETKRARATHTALVDATRAVVNTRGVLSPEAVARQAEVSVATFYVYFANKDEALAAAHRTEEKEYAARGYRVVEAAWLDGEINSTEEERALFDRLLAEHTQP